MERREYLLHLISTSATIYRIVGLVNQTGHLQQLKNNNNTETYRVYLLVPSALRNKTS
jgi:hypothetical protein